jgi:small nuclear ribonucleoprotein (snRNP)-like protein
MALTWVLGILSCLDGFMNIALEQTEEHVNGVVTNRYGDAFVRGNNGPLSFYRHICSHSHFIN